MTGVGGITGIALGIAACAALGSIDAPDLIPIPILQLPVVVVALAVMVLVGFAAGVLPAWRAARVDPSQILRED
jgi:putative ABC transport system permease protein